MGVRYWFEFWRRGLVAPANSMVFVMAESAVDMVETLTGFPWPKQPIWTLAPNAMVATMVVSLEVP